MVTYEMRAVCGMCRLDLDDSNAVETSKVIKHGFIRFSRQYSVYAERRLLSARLSIHFAYLVTWYFKSRVTPLAVFGLNCRIWSVIYCKERCMFYWYLPSAKYLTSATICVKWHLRFANVDKKSRAPCGTANISIYKCTCVCIQAKNS